MKTSSNRVHHKADKKASQSQAETPSRPSAEKRTDTAGLPPILALELSVREAITCLALLSDRLADLEEEFGHGKMVGAGIDALAKRTSGRLINDYDRALQSVRAGTDK